ncbi:hypothetical protein NDU88_006231 [Pleurodeles waltl]|uniref:Uncharacterized protein n=1 Tax=Pleurodeles waltl TaxID=8319 RepID=A0AAV7MYN7_PLEWA|nr:hypothetical protein NDU88_006231 [Pleurodeles waltl]
MSVTGRTVGLISFPVSISLQVSTHQKKGIRHAIAKDVRTLGFYGRQSTHCQKQWENLRRWAQKTAEVQLGMASQRGRGARRTLTPLMAHILAVAYPELDVRLGASQQPQGGLFPVCVVHANGGVVAAIDQVYPLSLPSPFCFVTLSLWALASSGRRAEALAMEGAASHRAQEAESTDGEGTSGTEGEGSTTAEIGRDSLDTDSSSDGISLVVADTSAPTPATGTSANPRASTALPAAPNRVSHAHSPRRAASPSPQAPQALPQSALLP